MLLFDGKLKRQIILLKYVVLKAQMSFKPESVKLCLQLLDGSDFKGHKIKVEKAKFEMKGNFDPTKAKDEAHKKKLSKKKEKQALTAQRKRFVHF
jgi:hypothetical protein